MKTFPKVLIVIAAVLLLGCSDGPHMSETDPMRWCAGTDPQVHMGRCDGVDYENYEHPQKTPPVQNLFNKVGSAGK